jgi:hypothetical protein
MKVAHLASSVLLVLLMTGTASADPTWTPGFPKPGQKAGEIEVKGTFTVPEGFKTKDTLEISAWPIGGGLVTTTTVRLAPGQTGRITWSGTIPGLTAKENYNVAVEIPITDGATTPIYAPDPGTSFAK